MKSFYGDMTPEGYQSGIVGTRLQKLVKGLDPEAARVEPHELAGNTKFHRTYLEELPDGRIAVIGLKGQNLSRNPPEQLGAFKTEAEALAFSDKVDRGGFDYPSIPITPAMREKILKEGLPLFLTPLGVGLAAEGLDATGSGDAVYDLLKHHYGAEPEFAAGGSVGEITRASLSPIGLPEPQDAPQEAVEDYSWSPLPLPPGEVSALTRASMARKRALSPVVSEGAWLAGYPGRVLNRLMGRNADGSVEVDPRGIANRATPHGADNQALMDGVQSLEPRGWSVEGRESKNVIDRRSKDPWEYD
jgi:hypothetical protein